MTYLYIVLSLAAGFLAGYLSSYFKEKGKNRALLLDIRKLTEEKEKVTSFFQLDIAKRKYQYESKSSLYFKYFHLLDEFGRNSNSDVYEKFLPIITKFNKDFSAANGNQKKELMATNYLSSMTNKLVMESNDVFLKIRHETNTIKLIATPKTLSILDELDNYHDLALKKSSDLLTEMGHLVIYRQQDKLDQKKGEVEAIGKLVNKTKDRLIEAVRNELDEI